MERVSEESPDAASHRADTNQPSDDRPVSGPLSQDPHHSTRLVGALQNIHTRRPIFLLSLLSSVLCSLIFPDVNWWPLAYVCLVPWLICVCTAAKARLLYAVSYVFGLSFFLVNIRWMHVVTWPGFLALSAYMAVFFPLAAWPIRHLYRRHGMSVAISAPIVWVAVEFIRSTAFSGFPWLLLAHTQYRVLTVIQVSDLVGAYGVSFILVMINGWLTDLLIQPIRVWRTLRYNSELPRRAVTNQRRVITRLPLGSLTTLIVVLGALIYGLAQSSRKHLREGPRIAMVQHDIAMLVNPRPGQRLHPATVFQVHLDLTKRAAAEKPDLIVLPETAIRGFINQSFLEADSGELEEILKRRYPPDWKLWHLKQLQSWSAEFLEAFQKLSTESGVPIVLGFSSLEWKPTEIPSRVDAYNSAFLVKPHQTRPVARYDKRHLVIFGEYVPFRYRYPGIYNSLNKLTPWGKDGRHYSLTPGDKYVIFEFESGSENSTGYRAGTPICYEEIMPYITREFTLGEPPVDGRKNIDLLLSISNDGWFLHTAELEQHLAASVFRAVENRIAVARSVNTGISAMVYPNGSIHSRVRLAEEKVQKLDAVTEALSRLREMAVKLQSQSSDREDYEKTRKKLGQVLGQDIRPALADMGPEFNFVAGRLSNLKKNLTLNNPNLSLSQEIFLAQIQDDLATVDRWRSRPWTAPAYAIDTALLDDRITLYTRWGDWFAWIMVGLSALMLLDWFRQRFRRITNRSSVPGKVMKDDSMD